MNNPIENQGEMQGLKYETSFGSAKGADTSEETSMFMLDLDTMLSMTVLLIACIALAILAHVFIY